MSEYACQRHYFGALAEKYFDDKTRDAAANTPRRAKTIEASSLPTQLRSYTVTQLHKVS